MNAKLKDVIANLSGQVVQEFEIRICRSLAGVCVSIHHFDNLKEIAVKDVTRRDECSRRGR